MSRRRPKLLDPAILIGLPLVAVAAFGIGASLECDCEKRARREREARRRVLNALAEQEAEKLKKRGWL